MRIKRDSKPKPHPLAGLPPPHNFWAMPLKLIAGLVVAAGLMLGLEAVTGTSTAQSQRKVADAGEWHPTGARNAVRLYSAYPDDVAFSELREGKNGSTCGTATGTFDNGYRETRRFVYTSSGVIFGDGYYNKTCDLS
uniref:hypothetical protein n=1 Tax=Burkholderia anthina TaxID=179879 RepID=UPI00158EE78C|nr:hypothetical protein [Burkholderia anthina]